MLTAVVLALLLVPLMLFWMIADDPHNLYRLLGHGRAIGANPPPCPSTLPSYTGQARITLGSDAMRVRVIGGLGLLCWTAMAAAPALAKDEKPKSLYELMGVPEPGLRGAELDAAVKAAEPFPLGSEKNPVRTKGIGGQRAYLARLRCTDGKAPRVLGRALGPPSPFGGVGDVYGVRCTGGETVAINMDMYHDHIEHRAVPGFTITDR